MQAIIKGVLPSLSIHYNPQITQFTEITLIYDQIQQSIKPRGQLLRDEEIESLQRYRSSLAETAIPLSTAVAPFFFSVYRTKNFEKNSTKEEERRSDRLHTATQGTGASSSIWCGSC